MRNDISNCMQALLDGMDRVLREKLGGDGPALLRLMRVGFETVREDFEVATVQISGIMSWNDLAGDRVFVNVINGSMKFSLWKSPSRLAWSSLLDPGKRVEDKRMASKRRPKSICLVGIWVRG